MNLKKNISSLKLPHYKATAGMESVRVAPPKEVLLPICLNLKLVFRRNLIINIASFTAR